MKVPDAVIKVKDLELIEFMDSVQVILNQGLYEMRVTDVAPTWTANNGETALYFTGDTRKLYFFVNGVWTFIGWNPSGSLSLFDADGDTGITPEFSTDEDIIRFYISLEYMYSMGSAGFAMTTGKPILFDGVGGDTKWVYSSSDQYLKGYTEGALRQEM